MAEMKKLILLAAFVLIGLVAFAQVIALTPSADATLDRSAEVCRLIASAQSGDELVFAKGEYYFAKSIVLTGKRHFALRAEPGTVFRFAFRADGLASGALTDFSITQCADIRLEGFTCTTDNPVSVSGRVVAVHPETHEYDVRLAGDSRLEGTEPLCAADTCDAFGAPDRVLCWQNRKPYKLLEPGLIRVTLPPVVDLKRLDVGHRIVHRLSVSGGVCRIGDSRRVVIRDVTVWRSPGLAFVISPLSADITFDGLRIQPAPDSQALYSSNADGIHVAGMSGTLTLKDCLFEGFGDDPLNVHGKASELHAYDPVTGEATCVWRLFHGEPRSMRDMWAVRDDVLAVYERATFKEKGRIRVMEGRGKGRFVLAAPRDFKLNLGDILINTRDRPKVRISNCTMRNVRSRGFLLQSQDVMVEGCAFAGIGGSGILVAPDINNWYESGPAVGLKIRNCRFERCGVRPSAFGALTVKVNHEGSVDAFPAGVHRDIEIADCTFRASGCGPTNICVASTTGVKVRGCRFEQMCGEGEPVVFVNCAEVAYDRTIYVDNVRGDDANPGTEAKPYRTIAKGLANLQRGGTMKLVAHAEPYHEALPLRVQHSGFADAYTTVDGGGATIDGLVPPTKGGWKDEGDGIWSRHLDNNAWVMDKLGYWCGAFPLVRFGTVDGVNVTSRTDLVTGSYYLFKCADHGKGHNTLYVKTPDGKNPDAVPVSIVSAWMNASMYRCEYAKIMNLTVRNQSWDCFSSGSCTNCLFERVDGSHAMDQGISAHGSVKLTVKNSRFHHNTGGGIVDVNVPLTGYCWTIYEDCAIVSNAFRRPIEFYGHSDQTKGGRGDFRLIRCTIRDNDLSRTDGYCLNVDREANVTLDSCEIDGKVPVSTKCIKCKNNSLKY